MKIKDNAEYDQVCRNVQVLQNMSHRTPAIRERIRILTDAIIDYEFENYPETAKAFKKTIPETFK